MENKELFPGLPDDLTGLSHEELNEALAAHQGVVKKIHEKDPEIADGSRSLQDLLDLMTQGVERIEKIREELAARGEAEAEFERQMAELTEKAGIEEPSDEEKATEEVAAEAEAVEPVAEVEVEEPVEAEPEPEPVAAETEVVEAEPVPEPVAAAAPPNLNRPPLPRVTVREHRPLEQVEMAAALVAAAGIQGVREGSELDRHGLAEAIMRKREALTSTAPGNQEKVIVASVNYGDRFPEDRKVYMDAGDTEKINGVVGPDALLTASGGLCAPVTPYYELQNIATALRPVRDALAGFNAVRGGINAAAPPTLADVTGVGIKTAAEDALGGTFATKECQVVECPPFSECLLSMVYRCLQFGNLNARAFPEMIATWNDLVIAAHARTAETALLDGIGAASTAVTTTQTYGAGFDLVYGILRAASAFRSRHRMTPDARLRVLLPSWVQDLVASDFAGQQFDRWEYPRDRITELLRRQGVEPSFYLDGETGEGQVFGAQSAGALLDFPDEVVWYIFPEGSFLFLDGGTLDLGIVRDSTLNSTNDFQIFAETFEQVCFVGVESYQVTSAVCPNGQVAAPETAFVCAT